MKRRARTPRIIVVLVTCPTRAVARRIAERVVAARLAACVNLVPGIDSQDPCNGLHVGARLILFRFVGVPPGVLLAELRSLLPVEQPN